MSENNTAISIFDIDLSPKPGKTYWADGNREWREEFIYFLLIDRFHDDLERAPEDKPNRQTGFGNADQLQRICGGTLSGITRHLDYIRDLGCTALWLSPVFQNNAFSYHGYAVENYLEVDHRFGTKKDFEDLVEKAHNYDIKVFLDIVLLRKENATLRFGRMYMRKLSVDGKDFMLLTFEKCLLAFSRVLYDEEIVVAYNSSQNEDDEEYIRVDPLLNPQGSYFRFIYGQQGSVNVLLNEEGNKHFIKLKLAPSQFVVLTNKATRFSVA